MLSSPRLAVHLRSLFKTRAPIGNLGTVQLRPTPRLFRLAMSHGRIDARWTDSRRLNHRMRSRVPPNRRDVRYAVRVDIVVDLYWRSRIRKGCGGGRTDEE